MHSKPLFERRTRNATAASIHGLRAAMWRMSRADTDVSAMHQQGVSGDVGAGHNVSRACCTDTKGAMPCKETAILVRFHRALIADSATQLNATSALTLPFPEAIHSTTSSSVRAPMYLVYWCEALL